MFRELHLHVGSDMHVVFRPWNNRNSCLSLSLDGMGSPTGDDEVGGLLAAEVQGYERVGAVQGHAQRDGAPLAQHVQLRRLARVLLTDQVVECDALPRPDRGTCQGLSPAARPAA